MWAHVLGNSIPQTIIFDPAGAITLIEQLDSARLPFDASTTESIGLALCLRTAPHHKFLPGFTLVERLPGAQAAVGRQESSQMTNKSEGATPCRSRSHSILGRAMAPQVKDVLYPEPLEFISVRPLKGGVNLNLPIHVSLVSSVMPLFV